MYQHLIIVGRLGGDPILKFTPQGQAVTTFNLATDRSWTDANGQRQEKTTWFRVSVWGKQAESCNQYLAKGRTALVEGEINEPQVYQRKNGEWAASLDVRAVNVRFLGGREAGPADGNASASDEAIPF